MRVQVNLNDELVKKIDDYADKIGTTRSALCSIFIGQGILGYDNATAVLNTVSDVLRQKATEIEIK